MEQLPDFWKYLIVVQNILLLYIAWRLIKLELRQRGVETVNSMIVGLLAPFLGSKLGRDYGIEKKIDELSRNNEENSKNRVDH